MSEYTCKTFVLTRQQQKSLHVYFTLLAKELNEHGVTVQKFLAEAVELEWTKESIKSLIWKPIQKALLDKSSTTELGKVWDIDLVFDHINRHIGTKWGLYVPWPSLPEEQGAIPK